MHVELRICMSDLAESIAQPCTGKGHGRIGMAVGGLRKALDEESRVDHVVVQVKYLRVAVAASVRLVPDPRGLVSQDVQQLVDWAAVDRGVEEFQQPSRAVLAQKLGKVAAVAAAASRRCCDADVDLVRPPGLVEERVDRGAYPFDARRDGVQRYHEPAFGIPPLILAYDRGFGSPVHLVLRFISRYLRPEREPAEECTDT